MESARTTYDMTAKARERYATELFDINRVSNAIEKRAKDGYRDLRVRQLHPFDLSRSPSARKLENWLENNHYRYAWYPTRPLLDPLYSSSSEDYPELAVFW